MSRDFNRPFRQRHGMLTFNPTRRQIVRVTFSLSPVRIFFSTPWFLRARIASAVDSFGGSGMQGSPAKPYPFHLPHWIFQLVKDLFYLQEQEDGNRHYWNGKKKALSQSPFVIPLITKATGTITNLKRIKTHLTEFTSFEKVFSTPSLSPIRLDSLTKKILCFKNTNITGYHFTWT